MCSGITLAIFSMDGNTPDEKDRLNMSARWAEMSFFNSVKIVVGRLLGPVDLSLFSQDIIKFTSCVSVSVMSNDAALGWWRKSWKDLLENLLLALVFFCNLTKIVIKYVSKM